MSKIHWLTLLVVASSSLLNTVQAQTQIFVQNNTSYDFRVDKIAVGGDKISNKAWKRGKDKIPSGERVSVLNINRAGKVNWMDPTPRFIEPGKTAIFTAIIMADNNPQVSPITLLLSFC